jgi:hypothetical protein
MKRTDIEQHVRQVTWPSPSPNLRARVLSAAVVTEQPITWSDRLWFSRAWRLSATGAVLILVVLDQFAISPRSAGFTPTTQAMAEAQAIGETARQVGLPADVAAALAQRSLSEASTPHTPSAALQAFDVEGPGGRR